MTNKKGVAGESDNVVPNSLPPFVARGLLGRFHQALDVLVGEWLVRKEIHIAIGSKERTVTSTEITARR